MTSLHMMNGDVWVVALLGHPSFRHSFFLRFLSALAVMIWTILFPCDKCGLGEDGSAVIVILVPIVVNEQRWDPVGFGLIDMSNGQAVVSNVR
jgi:hypothetical protein